MTLVDRAGPAVAPPPRRAGGRGLVRRHAGLLVLLALATALRLAVVAAYLPAFWFADSVDYVRSADLHEPLVHRPYGYSAFLSVLSDVLPLRGAVVVQHALGLVCVVLVYALLQHRGVRRRTSLVAAVPLALDGYLVDVEHYVLAEALFVVLLAAAVTVLLWKERPGLLLGGAAGLLLAAVTLTRTVGTAVTAVVLAYLVVRVLLRSVRWTALAGCALALAATVLPYMGWFASTHGAFAITDYTGHFLYGRVSNFVECDRLDVPVRLQGLCPLGAPAERPHGDYYVWDPYSPANYVGPGRVAPAWDDDDLKEFSLLAVKGQPLAFARVAVGSTLHYTAPGRHSSRKDTCPDYWRFPSPTPTDEDCPGRLATTGWDGEPVASGLRPGLADALRDYQRVVTTPGPLLALCVLAGVAALVLPGGRGGARERLDPALLAAVGVVLVAVPSVSAAFDYRYLLPTLVVLPLAGALATRRLPARPPAPPTSRRAA